MRAYVGTQHLIVRIVALVAGVLLVKYGVHVAGWEFVELNTLFTAIISANVFLLGFLLAGVLADFKESERLPGEITVSIEGMVDEVTALRDTKHPASADECLIYIAAFITELKRWFHKEVRTSVMLEKVRGFNRFFSEFEQYIPANFVARLKQEQSTVRRHILRIDTIRDTVFVAPVYRIAQLNSLFLIFGLVVADITPFTNALFFTAIISFLFMFLLALIRDLDNPFGFYVEGTTEDVSLKVLDDLQKRLRKEIHKGGK